MKKRRHLKLRTIGKPTTENSIRFLELIIARLTNESRDTNGFFSAEGFENKPDNKKRG